MTSREKFEAWYLENWGHTEDDHETLFERDPDSNEDYYRLGVRLAHEAWQAAELASEQKLTDMAVQLANAESKCRELAAENGELKSYRPRPGGQVMMEALDAFESQDDYPEGGMMDAFELLCCKHVETPATDAFLAEVRASALNDLCAAFVKHKELAGLDDSQEVTVFEATDALFHCAEQLDTQLRKGAAL